MVRGAAIGLMVMVVVTGALAEEQDTADRERRAPSGFLGMRGKKDVSTPLENIVPAVNDYTLQDSFPASLYGLRDDNGPVVLAVPWRVKKAPSGFLGMRGKKSGEEAFGEAGMDSELETLLKRAPSGFLGMRGKKAPSGFLGMRGKKAPSGFLGMRGKKHFDDESEIDAYIQALTAMVDGQQEKRAPSGFLGMRGKKAFFGDSSDEEMSVAGVDKRAPSGFLGMRG
ncbi:tachykinins [Procambarus clarkii]|uniref:Preprotachykinin n=1 Tax=Procambarus clarkii TaxID=6728 RepID=Q76LC8_PROCL|nr:tachykinins-like [Procambarus clarkii]BAC82426.1 preprotachykinin [Procambarus clarkii]BAC82427.1 preprotachykinin [Procambarus clarkii]